MDRDNRPVGPVTGQREVPNDEITWKDATIAQSSKDWGKMAYGYQWPASRLSRNEMAKLTIVSKHVGRPLNQLIKEAVDAYSNQMLVELGLVEKNLQSHSGNSSSD